VRQLVDLERKRDVRDLGPKKGERLTREQKAEVAVPPQWADVERRSADESPERPALGYRWGRPESLGLGGWIVLGRIPIDPRRLIRD
jgi:hypothetical protein